MVKKLILTLLCLLLCTCCFAESDFPAYDYLLELGYTPESIYDSPGWRTCNLMGGDGWWALTVSSDTDSRTIMALPEFDSMFDLSEMQMLFVDLVERFEWDISFYWPDYDSGAKMVKSFNIKKDIDKTSDNYMSKAEYVSALRKEFGLKEGLVVENRRTISLGDLEYSVPTGWAYDYSDEYRMHYHYVTGDPFTGGYFSTKCDVLDDSEKPDNAEAAEELLLSVADGISNGLVNNEYEIIDLRYPELSGFQGKAISGTFAAYKEQGYENLSYFWTAVSGNTVYTFGYTNVMASDVNAKSEFEEILSTVVLSDSAVQVDTEIPEDVTTYININDQYSEYARNPDAHKYELIEFSGEVIQVIEGEGFSQYRVAVNNDSDMVFLVNYARSEGESRILEDDIVTVRGVSAGIVTYESTMGGRITVPSCYASEMLQYESEEVITIDDETASTADHFDVTGYIYSTSYSNYLLLDITNNSGIDAALDISVRFFDENGNLVGVSNSNERAVANGTRILSVATNDLAFASYEYEITPQKESIYRCVNDAFKVEQTIAPGKVILAVTNTSPFTAEFVRCDAIFTKDGNVVYHKYAYVEDGDNEIKPGKTQYEEIKSREEFDEVMIFVHGKADK